MLWGSNINTYNNENKTIKINRCIYNANSIYRFAISLCCNICSIFYSNHYISMCIRNIYIRIIMHKPIALTKHTTFNMNTSRFNTSKMYGYHRPKNHKKRFIIEHVVTSSVSVIAADSIEEALEIFIASTGIPYDRVKVHNAY